MRLAAAVVSAYVVLCGAALLGPAHGDVAWFVHFGKEGTELPLAHQVLGPGVRVPLKDGQDGETFWVLARDPLLLHAAQTAAALDRPAYRAQRIAYPLLASPWRVLGGERGLLWGLVVTNLLLVAIGTTLLDALVQDLRGPPWGGLVFGLTPSVIIAAGFDMSDVTTAVGVVATVLLLRRHRYAAAVGAGIVAALAKEPSLLALAALAVLAPGLERGRRLSLIGIPAACACAWALYVRWRLGWPATSLQELTGPLRGYLDAYRRGWRPVGNWGDGLVAVAVGVVGVTVAVRWWHRRSSLLLVAALPYALMVPFLSAQVLDLQTNSWRAIGPALTLLAVDLAVEAGSHPPAERFTAEGLRSTPTPARSPT